MTIGKALHAKLFLEGIEVPLIGATMTHTVNQASIAYIDVVPHATINNVKPRTLVHLFVRDFNNSKDNHPYILAFEGEVFGISFSKTPSSRSMSLSCIDESSYWDNVLTYFFNAQQSLGKGAEELNTIAYDLNDIKKQNISGKTVTHSIASYFMKTMAAGVKKGDFLDGLVAVYKDISKINEFYSYAETRLRIVDRIKLKSSGKLNDLLEEKQALDWFSGIIGTGSGFQTLRQVLQDLMSIIFHDFVSVPFPASIDNPGMTGASLRSGSKVKQTIGEFIFKPNMYMLPPPCCNIFFPDEYSSFNFSRNFFQEPTRLIYKPEMPLMGTGTKVSLAHAYSPESFAHFMGASGKKPLSSDHIGDGPLQVTKDRFGFYGDPDTNKDSKDTNGSKKKEQQFLTNEELMKGILIAHESMVPSSSQFRSSLSEFGRKDLARKVADYLFFKKRFQNREVQITSHLKMSVVPGFTTMILDDSEANQTVLAYCSSITHRIYCNQGGYTNVSLSYARTVDEQAATSGKSGEPLIPPWFDEALFGKISKPTKKSKSTTIQTGIDKRGDKQLIVSEKLSSFYASLLGTSGSKTLNDLAKEETVFGAASKLIDEYKKAKTSGSVHEFINLITSRDYVKMREAFDFLGATTKSKDDNGSFMEFTGDNLVGKTGGSSSQIKIRRKVIEEYRAALQTTRGFHG